MKKILLLFFSVACISLQAQINVVKTTEQEKPKEEKEVVQVYDSLMSLNSTNVMQHLGQTLFLRGRSIDKERGGFRQCFFTKSYKDDSLGDIFIYKPKEIEEYGSKTIVTDYDSIIGKYYQVTNVTMGDKDNYDTSYCMELKEKESGEIIYFIFEVSNKRFDNTPTGIFLTLGYYEKMKRMYVGREFYTNRYDYCKIDSEEYIDIPFKTKFKCVDVGVSTGEVNGFYAIMENPKYGKVRGVFEEDQINKIRNFITISDYDLCIKKYGTYYGPLVVKKTVVRGMTRAMVREIEGDPEKVNYTEGSYGFHEQWVYRWGLYIYFENDKVTTIQK